MSSKDGRITILLRQDQREWVDRHKGQLIGKLLREGLDYMIGQYDEQAYQKRMEEANAMLTKNGKKRKKKKIRH